MNTKPLSAAYEVMTSSELAAAAYSHAENELETMRIKAAIPRKTYTMLDAQFLDALDRIHVMALAWSSDYWRLQFLYAADCAAMLSYAKSDEHEQADSRLESINHLGQVIAAHFEGLEEVCANHGIDHHVVLSRGSILERTNKKIKIDQDYKAEVMARLEGVLTNSGEAK